MFTQLRVTMHLYRRDGAPELLYVHGNDQKYQLTKFFGWQKINEMSIFKNRKKKISKNIKIIFFFLFIEDKNFYLENFEFLIKTFKKKLPNNLKIKFTLTELKIKHINFKNSLSLILKRFNLNRKIKIVDQL